MNSRKGRNLGRRQESNIAPFDRDSILEAVKKNGFVEFAVDTNPYNLCMEMVSEGLLTHHTPGDSFGGQVGSLYHRFS